MGAECFLQLTFNSSSDEEESVLVVFAQVTRVQPALCIQSLLRLVGHVEVAHEDVATPEADLTVSLLIGVVQLCLATWEFLTTAAGQNKISLTHLSNGRKSSAKSSKSNTW